MVQYVKLRHALASQRSTFCNRLRLSTIINCPACSPKPSSCCHQQQQQQQQQLQ